MELGKIIKLTKDIMLAKIFNYKIPLRVTHNITYNCNLACPFCLLKMKLNMPDAPEMDTHQIKKMMNEFREMGTRFWLFSGGEPLLRQNIGELISYAKEKMNFHCSLSTNGTLLAERIKNNPRFKQLDFVQISLEGPKEIHDRLRGAGTYDKIISTLDVLRKLCPKTKIAILALISQSNLNYLHFLIKLAAQYNINLVFQVIGIHPAAAPEIKEFFPPKVIFKKFIEELIKEKRNRSIISSFEYLKMIKGFWPDIPHRIKCYAGRFYCEITPSGFVAPCCAKLDMNNENCNGLKIGFKKAFFQLNNMSKCRDCYYAGPQESNIIFSMFPSRIATLYKDYFYTMRLVLK